MFIQPYRKQFLKIFYIDNKILLYMSNLNYPSMTGSTRTRGVQNVVFKGFLIRLIAAILDIIILFTFWIVVLIMSILMAVRFINDETLFVYAILVSLAIGIATLVYKPFMEASEYQATFGKYLLGMKIVDQSGERIMASTSFIRTLAYLAQTAIPVLNFLTMFLLLMVGFTEYKQGLHDMAAKTYVVSKFWQGPLPIEETKENFGP